MLPEGTERELAARNTDRATVARHLAESHGTGTITGREVDHAAGIREDEATEAALELWDNLLAADHEVAMRMAGAAGGDLNRLYSMVSAVAPFSKSITVGGN